MPRWPHRRWPGCCSGGFWKAPKRRAVEPVGLDDMNMYQLVVSDMTDSSYMGTRTIKGGLRNSVLCQHGLVSIEIWRLELRTYLYTPKWDCSHQNRRYHSSVLRAQKQHQLKAKSTPPHRQLVDVLLLNRDHHFLSQLSSFDTMQWLKWSQMNTWPTPQTNSWLRFLGFDIPAFFPVVAVVADPVGLSPWPLPFERRSKISASVQVPGL